ncbi:lasso peptide isopeptide bond-forming cyclase [Peribacillus loiseleuriae]|uniref:asparagine synthase (glutamine-hydrolyzing) n=1 Tax=Peribacillus loiseleuriae TaxID=1679170 RepID=A0A0K9GZ17_9BACI|nr:lasso peptide isopeptide bond-forming cyclase [Peribacillus loiseleuriae]KMY51903.1 asparagine synthase [Peribacillus loiseleuriae]
MSAITGIIHFNDEPISIENGRGLMNALQKYPADNVQTWNDERTFLGCHAQWITPESIGEPLPYYDYEAQLAITADAIIDNRQELFEKLQVDYADRKGMPDSKLILLSYIKWGEECPKLLVGDFAFMIWDQKNQKLFGARDFSGSRTLYFYRGENKFAFCTTIAPLLVLPYVERKLNEQWLAEFLAIPGMNDAVDTSITAFKNIEQLPPSHSFSLKEGRITFSRYCTITNIGRLNLKNNEEYEEAFRHVFQDAVTARLRTHHGVGAHLSGGLDSSSVVSFASRALRNDNKILHTFSSIPPTDFIDWTPKNTIADERPFISSTVDFVGNIRDHYYDFAETNPLLEIDELLQYLEMPYKFFANSNWIDGIFREARQQGIGVLLNGGRGNLSVSWGPVYNYYAILLKRLKWIRLYKELNQYSKKVGGNRLRRVPNISRIAFPSMNKFFPDETDQYPLIINPELASKTDVFAKLEEHGIKQIQSPYEHNVYEERKKHFEELYSWNATGALGAKLSLRYSLWKRDPTNDLNVIRFCLTVPEEQYVQNGVGRSLIRRATETYLPDKVRLNQTIRGVQGADCVHRMTPYWDDFIDELDVLRKDSKIGELMNTEVLNNAFEKMKQGPRQENSFDLDYQISMYSLIIYRFIKQFT